METRDTVGQDLMRLLLLPPLLLSEAMTTVTAAQTEEWIRRLWLAHSAVATTTALATETESIRLSLEP